MKKVKLFLIFSFLFCNWACQNQILSSQKSDKSTNKTSVETIEAAATATNANDEKTISVEDIVVEQESLEYEGYEVKQFLTKKKFDADSPIADIADAVLQKNGKTIFKFEGTYYPNGNQIEFGLFSFLGDKTKQLIIYETSNRFGRIQIIGLSPKPKILFDSKNWGGFREFIYIDDPNEDGKYEISLQTEEYLSFEDLSHINVPQIGYQFKYDNKSESFLFTNKSFQDFYTEELNERVSKIKFLNSPNSTDENLKKERDAISNSSRNNSNGFDEKVIKDFIEIFLAYIYADKENEAWEFFGKKYNLADKEDRKNKIKAALNEDPIYKFFKSNAH